MNKVCRIYYKKAPDNKLLSYYWYIHQIINICFFDSNKIYLSNNNRLLERLFIDLSSRIYKEGVCTTLDIGFNLKFFTIPLLLQFPDQYRPEMVTQESYEQTMYTLLFVTKIHPDSRALLEKTWKISLC